MKYIFLFLLFFISCTKQEQVQPQSEVSQPVLIQIEAVHSDGNIVLSPVVVAR
jgi:hypothetical protein